MRHQRVIVESHKHTFSQRQTHTNTISHNAMPKLAEQTDVGANQTAITRSLPSSDKHSKHCHPIHSRLLCVMHKHGRITSYLIHSIILTLPSSMIMTRFSNFFPSNKPNKQQKYVIVNYTFLMPSTWNTSILVMVTGNTFSDLHAASWLSPILTRETPSCFWNP